MNFSIRTIIRGLVAPKHHLSCSTKLWQDGLLELGRRGQGQRESGAFLLGSWCGERRTITRFVYYDDLEPHCLDTGIVIFDGSGYGLLWQLCRATGLSVMADIHTHPGLARQSSTDRVHPMVATPGHVALIVPEFAKRIVYAKDLGVYEYIGEHRWHDYTDFEAARFFYIGIWR